MGCGETSRPWPPRLFSEHFKLLLHEAPLSDGPLYSALFRQWLLNRIRDALGESGETPGCPSLKLNVQAGVCQGQELNTSLKPMEFRFRRDRKKQKRGWCRENECRGYRKERRRGSEGDLKLRLDNRCPAWLPRVWSCSGQFLCSSWVWNRGFPWAGTLAVTSFPSHVWQ